eukprot:TCONS_00019093-protein
MWPNQILSSLLLNFVYKDVCYDGYGCFSNAPPYDISFALLPRDPSILNTTYYWHTREESKPEVFKAPFRKSPSMKPKDKTYIVTHGFIENYGRFWVKPMINELLKNNDCNVIFVDWKDGAWYPYNQAFGDARVVAVEISQLIIRLHQEGMVSLDSLHLIGFSLGAHVMGRVGHLLKDQHLHVSRITGLDPAGPKLAEDDTHRNISLDETDAQFVDIIHSDAETPLLGTLKRQGHVDFYPNGGLHQPGCKKTTSNFDLFKPADTIFDLVSCSHYRAIIYFIRSINHPHAFKAFKCKSYKAFLKGECTNCRKDEDACQHQGFHVSRNARGKYYLLTMKKKPFSGHHYHVCMKTGNIPYASLSGMIDFRLFGEKGTTQIHTIDRDILHTRGSSTHLTFVTPKNLGEILKMKVKAYTGVWYEDKWFMRDLVIKKMGGKRWEGCVRKWIFDKFLIIRPNGKKCKMTDQRKIVMEVLHKTA